MSISLNTTTIETIQSTVPLLEAHGETITQVFYQQLFENHPHLKNIFNMSNQQSGAQTRALSDAVIAYAKHIHEIEVLVPTVQRIANKHASLNVQAKHYGIVGATLLGAIKQVLNLPNDHPALIAWGEAYAVLANIFIATEAEIYQKNRQKSGGWAGFRDFYIQDMVQETPTIKSFYLKPLDGEAIPEFRGGQYIAVKVRPSDSANEQIRQYSLTHASEFRISVKAEPEGSVSSFLHNSHIGTTVSLQNPMGQFNLSDHHPKHVFCSAGIGITPLISMIHEAHQKGQIKPQDILLIQCVKNQQERVFQQEIDEIRKVFPFHFNICFEFGTQADHTGRLTSDIIEQWLAQNDFNAANAQVYICGSPLFMGSIKQIFSAIQFKDHDIHYEVFGPTVSI